MSPVGCSWKNENISPASISTNGKVTLSWSNVQGGTSYNIYVSTTPGVTKLNSNKIQNVANPISITELEIGTTYYFIVTVVNALGERELSREVSYKVIESEGFIEIEDYLARQDLTIFFDTSSNRLPGHESMHQHPLQQSGAGVVVESAKVPIRPYRASGRDEKSPSSCLYPLR